MKYFTYKEFDSPDAPGSGSNMRPSTLEKLDKAREIAGIPFRINSGYRTVAHNRKVGGKRNSSHRKGYATDISATNDVYRWRIVEALIKVGFNRIGIARTFIHADDDPSKSQGVIWLY